MAAAWMGTKDEGTLYCTKYLSLAIFITSVSGTVEPIRRSLNPIFTRIIIVS